MDLLVKLEQDKLQILKVSFEKSLLESRITWLEAGDKNTIFFHKFIEHCRIINSIWALKNDDGILVKEQVEISQVAHSHFKSYYIVDGNFSVSDQIKVIMEFPKLFTDVEGDEIFMSIPLLELKGVIMASTRSKILGPNEWTMELF